VIAAALEMVLGVPRLALAWTHFNVRVMIYAAFTLTVLRMVPAALILVGLPLRWHTTASVGWFGPRGQEQPHAAVVLSVLPSVFAHGLSAVPAGCGYACYAERPQPCKKPFAALAKGFRKIWSG